MFYKKGSLVLNQLGDFTFGYIIEIKKYNYGVQYYIFWQDDSQVHNGWFDHYDVVFISE